MSYKPSIDEFTERMWNLNPSGDFTLSYELLVELLEKLEEEGSLNPYSKKPWTFEDMVKAYKEYVDWWDITYQDREDKYIKKEEKKEDIKQFLQFGHFRNKYTIRKNVRDKYLFGDYSTEDLQQQLNVFKQKLGLS